MLKKDVSDGVRSLSPENRKALLLLAQEVLSIQTVNPFLMSPASVAMLSDNEQAAYTWTSANLDNNRLRMPLVESDSRDNRQTPTLGVVHLGDWSTQISFALPAEGVVDGAYRLHIGSQVSWNVFARGYEGLGFEAVKRRHLLTAADSACSSLSPNSAVVPRALEYCFFAGYSESVFSELAQRQVEVHGPSVPAGDQLARCMDGLRNLVLPSKHVIGACEEVNGDECGLQGHYQPRLPQGTAGHFVCSGLFKYSWELLKLADDGGSLSQFRSRANWLCSISFSELVLYDASLLEVDKDQKHTTLLPYSCFLAGYMLVLLQGGHGAIVLCHLFYIVLIVARRVAQRVISLVTTTL